MLVAVVVAIVLGILGMHALNLHGSTTMEATPDMAGMSGPVEALATSIAVDHHSQSVVAAPNRGGHGAGDMMMLCLAMLVGSGIALLAVLVLRRGRRSSWHSTRSQLTVAAPRPVPSRAGTGPPAAWAFSVIRC